MCKYSSVSLRGKVTNYITIILVRSVRKFLDRYFLSIEKVQAFLDLILSRALEKVQNSFIKSIQVQIGITKIDILFGITQI